MLAILTSLLLIAVAEGDSCCAGPLPCLCCEWCECPHAYSDVLVKRVVDGDTIEVAKGGEAIRVRLIGVDTPETVDPRKKIQSFGPEASAFAKKLLEGRRVRLTFEKNRRDAFGRLIALVYLNGDLVNLRLVREGYGRYYRRFKFTTYPMLEFERAEDEARDAKRGLWRDVRPASDDEYLRTLPASPGD